MQLRWLSAGATHLVLTTTFVIQEVLSRKEAESVFLSSTDNESKQASQSGAEGPVEQDSTDQESAMSYEIFCAAINMVGQLCARKLVAVANAPGDRAPELYRAAIYDTLKSTQWLSAGLRHRRRASERIR